MVTIRIYNQDKDRETVRELLLELLNNEKSLEPESPSGTEVAQAYMDWMLKRCQEYSGQIFVADEGGKVIGFISVLGRFRYDEPDELPYPYALVSELIVHAPYRSRGYGHMLLEQAEQYARQQGAPLVSLEATAANTHARKFYEKSGYREISIEYIKKL